MRVPVRGVCFSSLGKCIGMQLSHYCEQSKETGKGDEKLCFLQRNGDVEKIMEERRLFLAERRKRKDQSKGRR